MIDGSQSIFSRFQDIGHLTLKSGSKIFSIMNNSNEDLSFYTNDCDNENDVTDLAVAHALINDNSSDKERLLQDIFL